METTNETFGGSWLWVVLLFFLLVWNNGGIGGNNATSQVNNDFMYSNLKSTLDNGFSNNTQQNFSIQKDILNQTNGLASAIANLGYQEQNCCCTTNRNIDAVRYENAQNTASINTVSVANTQKILDELCEMKMQAKDEVINTLRSDLQSAQLQLGNVAQTQNIIGQLKPVPIPAYITCSPYQTSCMYNS